MTGERQYFLGTIMKIRGVKGELLLVLKNHPPEILSDMESVLIEIDGQRVPFFISRAKSLSPDSAMVIFEQIDDPAKAQRLVGCRIYTEYPAGTAQKTGDYYADGLVGWVLYDKTHGEIGVVDKVLLYSDNPVFQIWKGKQEILVPANEELIISMDPDTGIITMDLPEGLLDLNIR